MSRVCRKTQKALAWLFHTGTEKGWYFHLRGTYISSSSGLFLALDSSRLPVPITCQVECQGKLGRGISQLAGFPLMLPLEPRVHPPPTNRLGSKDDGSLFSLFSSSRQEPPRRTCPHIPAGGWEEQLPDEDKKAMDI